MEVFHKHGKINPAGLVIVFCTCILVNAGRAYALPENLDVFEQWVRWNNPGSLLIHELIRQANEYYDIRDVEIARLKTMSSLLVHPSHTGPLP
jgi:hypothetical protein